jgi:predicted O-methyltransferase YrrM
MSLNRIHKILGAILAFIYSPQKSLSWVSRGSLLTDHTIIDTSYWCNGSFPRKQIATVFPKSISATLEIPQAFQRTFRTSISITEATNLAGVIRAHSPKRILEIGTFDGNTALLLAVNAPEDARVVTVDLPPSFDPIEDREMLGFSNEKINLTPRDQVATQYQKHPRANIITQIYGDSATLNWKTFGGPFDFIFIDGCHKAAYVESDTIHAFEVLAQDGVIAWHDYGDILDVSTVLDRMRPTFSHMEFCVLEGTRLAIAYPKVSQEQQAHVQADQDHGE